MDIFQDVWSSYELVGAALTMQEALRPKKEKQV